jgi:hypothetical protein
VVPIDAIVEGDRPYVLLVNRRNRVVRTPVVLGIQGPNFFQIASGVQVGDRVIVGNQGDYQPGEKVSPSPVDLDLTTFKQTSIEQETPPPPQTPGLPAQSAGRQR